MTKMTKQEWENLGRSDSDEDVFPMFRRVGRKIVRTWRVPAQKPRWVGEAYLKGYESCEAKSA